MVAPQGLIMSFLPRTAVPRQISSLPRFDTQRELYRCLRPHLSTLYRRHLSSTWSRQDDVRKTMTVSTAPRTRDRGPPSEEDTQTDFGKMDIFATTPPPTSAVDTCKSDGFVLNSGVRVTGGSGVMIVGGEAFGWKPWAFGGAAGGVFNSKGQVELDEAAWGLIRLAWPKPDLLVLGTGPNIAPVSPATRTMISELGVRLEVQDTRNASAQFNLLATERGTQQVAAALVPIGYRQGS